MNKEKALKNQGLEFREDILMGGGYRMQCDFCLGKAIPSLNGIQTA